MTKLRYLAWIGIMAAVVGMLVGCDGDSDDDGGSTTAAGLAGVWTTTMGAIDQGDPDIRLVLTFNADKTYSATEDGAATDSGTWATNGNVLTLSHLDGMTATYVLSGNTLTITVTETESGAVMVLNCTRAT